MLCLVRTVPPWSVYALVYISRPLIKERTRTSGQHTSFSLSLLLHTQTGVCFARGLHSLSSPVSPSLHIANNKLTFNLTFSPRPIKKKKPLYILGGNETKEQLK